MERIDFNPDQVSLPIKEASSLYLNGTVTTTTSNEVHLLLLRHLHEKGMKLAEKTTLDILPPIINLNGSVNVELLQKHIQSDKLDGAIKCVERLYYYLLADLILDDLGTDHETRRINRRILKQDSEIGELFKDLDSRNKFRRNMITLVVSSLQLLSRKVKNEKLADYLNIQADLVRGAVGEKFDEGDDVEVPVAYDNLANIDKINYVKFIDQIILDTLNRFSEGSNEPGTPIQVL